MAFSYNSNNITAVNWNGNSVSAVNYNGTGVWSLAPVGPDYLYFEFLEPAGLAELTFIRNDSSASPIATTLEYSTDKETWTEGNFELQNVQAGDKVYVRGTGTGINSAWNKYYYIYGNMLPKFKIGGDITTLIDPNGEIDLTSSTSQNYAFGNLFLNCTTLIDASDLKFPTTSSVIGAFYSMFKGCTNLVKAPSVIATTTLGTSTLQSLFSGCTSLVTGPELKATTLTSNCYRQMFENCSALQYLKADFTAWNDAANATQNWLSNVDPYILKLELPDALGNDLALTHDNSHVPVHCVVENNVTYSLPLTFSVEDIASLSGTYPALSLQQHGNPGYTPELQYSINGGAWTDYTIGNTLYTTATVGDYIQFRAKTTNSAFSTGGNDGYTFVAEDGRFTVFGNIQSLLDKDMLTDSVPSNAFYGLFMSFNGNVGHVRCPATDLGSWCYAGLFRANADPNFKRAFTDFPALYATERCYQTVYYDCAYLRSVPHFACTSGGANCFMRTFYNCTSLNVEYFCIPFQSLAYRQCYEMFVNAGTIHKFELMATDIGYDRCLNSLFAASNPLHIKVHFTDWQWDSGFPTDNWVNSIITDTSDCIFECPTALGTQSTIDRGNAKVPANWTVVNF